MKLFILTLMFLPLYCLTQETFSFPEGDKTFINQIYICPEYKSPAEIRSITLLEKGDVSICIITKNDTLTFRRIDIQDFQVEVFGNERVIFLPNECKFVFEVTGTTPKPVRTYFKDVYWGRK